VSTWLAGPSSVSSESALVETSPVSSSKQQAGLGGGEGSSTSWDGSLPQTDLVHFSLLSASLPTKAQLHLS